MSLFNLPTADAPLGPKNGGTAAYDKMIVQPVSQPGGAQPVVSGTTVDFNFRSDSSKWINYRESRLYCRYSIALGPPEAADVLVPTANVGNGAARSRANLPPNVRMTAAPNAALMSGGCKYTMNGTVVENQVGTYYECAAANIWAKQCRLGTSQAPQIPYSNLDVRTGKFSRPYNDCLSVVNKPNGLRATEWSFDEFCGQSSAQGAVYPAGAAADLAGGVFGDMGPLIMLRLITPPGSMDNTLFIDGQLRDFNAGALQELVIICVHEQRVALSYAPPQELPISTVKTAVI